MSTTLIALFGFTGALYGTSISVLGAAAYLVFLFHKETGYSRAHSPEDIRETCLAEDHA